MSNPRSGVQRGIYSVTGLKGQNRQSSRHSGGKVGGAGRGAGNVGEDYGMPELEPDGAGCFGGVSGAPALAPEWPSAYRSAY